MHRIITSHLKEFVTNFSLESDSATEQFEKFAIYSVLASQYRGQFDIQNIALRKNECGITFIAIAAEGTLVTHKCEGKDIDIIFIRVNENFDLKDLEQIKDSIKKFACFERTDLFANTNAKKPNIKVRYVTTDIMDKSEKIVITKEFENEIAAFNICNDVELQCIDRDELVRLWMKTFERSVKFQAFSVAALPAMPKIQEAYIACVPAHDFVQSVLLDDERCMHSAKDEKTSAISNTLRSGYAKLFPLINDGITIASYDVKVQGNVFTLQDFQIIDGNKTAYALWKNREALKDVMLCVKILEVADEKNFSDIVRFKNACACE